MKRVAFIFSILLLFILSMDSVSSLTLVKKFINENVVISFSVENTGTEALSEPSWYSKIDAYKVPDYNSPSKSGIGAEIKYGSREDWDNCFNVLTNKYIPGCECSHTETGGNVNILDPGETWNITCEIPAGYFGSTGDLEAVVFWAWNQKDGYILSEKSPVDTGVKIVLTPSITGEVSDYTCDGSVFLVKVFTDSALNNVKVNDELRAGATKIDQMGEKSIGTLNPPGIEYTWTSTKTKKDVNYKRYVTLQYDGGGGVNRYDFTCVGSGTEPTATLTVDPMVDAIDEKLANVRVEVDGEIQDTSDPEKVLTFPGLSTLKTHYIKVFSTSGRPFSHFWDHNCSEENEWLDTASNPYTFTLYGDRQITPLFKTETEITVNYDGSSIRGTLTDEKVDRTGIYSSGHYAATCGGSETLPINTNVDLYYYKDETWYYIGSAESNPYPEDGYWSYDWQCIPGVEKIKAVYTPTSWYYVGNETEIDAKCDLSAEVRVCDAENCHSPSTYSGYYQTTCKNDACTSISCYPSCPTFECKEPIGVELTLKNSGDYNLNDVVTDLEFLVINDKDGSISRIENFIDPTGSLGPGTTIPVFHSVSSSHFADLKEGQHLGFKINVKANGVDFVSVDDKYTPKIDHLSIYSDIAHPQMEFWCDSKCEVNKLCNCTGIYRHPDNIQGDIQFLYRTDLVDVKYLDDGSSPYCVKSNEISYGSPTQYFYQILDCKVNSGDNVTIHFNPLVSGSILNVYARVLDNNKDEYYSNGNYCEYSFYPESGGQCQHVQGLVIGQPTYEINPDYITCPNETRTIEVTVPKDKPDLVISDILSTDNKITYEIANRGSAGAFPSISNINVDGNQFSSSVGFLSPGVVIWYISGISWRKYCSSPSDTVNVKVCADYPLNYVPESNEGNNCLTKDLSCCEKASEIEICDNFVDDNCNGKIDCVDLDCAGATTPIGTCCQAPSPSDCIATDSDNGIDEFQRGICTPSSCTNNVCRAGTQLTDNCLNVKTLLEYYTSDNQCLNTQINCPDNFICSDGRCVSVSPPSVDCSVNCAPQECNGKTGPFGFTCCQAQADCSAVDTDGGKDLSKQGTCIPYTCTGYTCQPNLAGQSTDSCSGNTLTEYYPSDNSCPSSSIPCSNGICSEGRCIACQGQVELNLIPSEVRPSGASYFYASGLSGCNGQTVHFKRDNCNNPTDVQSCIIGSDGHGCVVGFKAPSSSGTYTYFACVDENKDNIYGPDEQASANLKVEVATACVYNLTLSPTEGSSMTPYSPNIIATDSSMNCPTTHTYNVQYSIDGDCSVSSVPTSITYPPNPNSFTPTFTMTGNRPCTVELRIIAPDGVWVAVGRYKVFKSEVCYDGIDNDGNGKIDCFDNSTCRGHEGPGALCCAASSDCPAKDLDANDEYTKGTCIQYTCLGYECAVDKIYVDSCKDRNTVIEYNATKQSCLSTLITCPNNYECYDGKCIPVQLQPENCNDGVDNDGDGSIDCADLDCRGQVGHGWTCCQSNSDCTAIGDAYNIFDKGSCQPYSCQSNYCKPNGGIKIDTCSGSQLIEYNPSGFDCLPGPSAPITCPTGYSCYDGRCNSTSNPIVSCSASCADPSCVGQAGPTGEICCQSDTDCSAYDTDSGNNPGKRGICTPYTCTDIGGGRGKACKEGSHNIDECQNTNTLTEYYPSGNSCLSDPIKCTDGICYDGKCIQTACEGTLTLTLVPNSVNVGGQVYPSASGLNYCNGKTVHFKSGSCTGTEVGSCIIGADGHGCMMNNPNTYFNAPTSEGTYTYYACIDAPSMSGSAVLDVFKSIYGLSISYGDPTHVGYSEHRWDVDAHDKSNTPPEEPDVTFNIIYLADSDRCDVDVTKPDKTSFTIPRGATVPGVFTAFLRQNEHAKNHGLPCKLIFNILDRLGNLSAYGFFQVCNPEYSDSSHPNFCGDGIDNNCDGLVDCADPQCKGQVGPGGQTCCLADTDCGSDSCSDTTTDTLGGGICTQTHNYCDLGINTCKSTQQTYADTCEGGDADNPSVTHYDCSGNQCVGTTTTKSDSCSGTDGSCTAENWDCVYQTNGAGMLVQSPLYRQGQSASCDGDSAVKHYVCKNTDPAPSSVSDSCFPEDTDCMNAGQCYCNGGSCQSCDPNTQICQDYQCTASEEHCDQTCDSIFLTSGYNIYSSCRSSKLYSWEVSTHSTCASSSKECYCYMNCTQYAYDPSTIFQCPYTMFFCMFGSEYPPYGPDDKMGYIFPNRPIDSPNTFEEYKLTAPNDLHNVNVKLNYDTSSNYNLYVIWNWVENDNPATCPSSSLNDCGPGKYSVDQPGNKVCTDASTVIMGQNIRVRVEKISGTGKYNISVSSNEITPSDIFTGSGFVSTIITGPTVTTTPSLVTTTPTETTTPYYVTTTTTPAWKTVQLSLTRLFEQLINIFR